MFVSKIKKIIDKIINKIYNIIIKIYKKRNDKYEM